MRAALEKPGAIIPIPPGLDIMTVLKGVWMGIWPERRRP